MTVDVPRLALALLLTNAFDVAPEGQLGAQTAPPTLRRQDVPKEVEAFARRPVKEQIPLVEALQKRLTELDNPYLVAMRACSAAAMEPSNPRTDAFPSRKAGDRAPKPDPRRATDLPQQVHYVFGLGVINGPPPPSRIRKERAKLAAEGRRQLVHTALMGMLPGTDAAVADLLRQLDDDPAADRFAAFLEAWRNGDESFYQALDRTAGTQAGVFFYDAMLGDFTSSFAKTPEQKALLQGLDSAHQALHLGFLSYRQYRAFREAIAWSLVLPPESPLPPALRRYEAKVKGSYSLREQVMMVLATVDYDPRKLTALVQGDSAPLPDPIWSELYDPYPKWNEVFFTAMEQMIAESGNTDAHLQKARTQLQSWAEEVRGAASRQLGAAPTPR